MVLSTVADMATPETFALPRPIMSVSSVLQAEILSGEFVPSGLFSNSFGFVGTQGSSGNVIVTTPKLDS